jgi:hypothetical protein
VDEDDRLPSAAILIEQLDRNLVLGSYRQPRHDLRLLVLNWGELGRRHHIGVTSCQVLAEALERGGSTSSRLRRILARQPRDAPTPSTMVAIYSASTVEARKVVTRTESRPVMIGHPFRG